MGLPWCNLLTMDRQLVPEIVSCHKTLCLQCMWQARLYQHAPNLVKQRLVQPLSSPILLPCVRCRRLMHNALFLEDALSLKALNMPLMYSPPQSDRTASTATPAIFSRLAITSLTT
eukprot:GHRR01036008.1.p1 GENE.GHRR01036008.1~~GHRR01036008.1.p1  ORF type:complete len:116 (-),score=4.54 GHRR01036008.1:77-424(-)